MSGLTINQLVQTAHDAAFRKGFWNDAMALKDLGVGEHLIVPTMLMLVVSELAEAMEEHRRLGADKTTAPLAEELADAVIRAANLAGWLGIDLEREIVDKMRRNEERPRLHNKRY